MTTALTGTVEMVSERALGVQEASAVAALGEGVFLVVCDENGIFRCQGDHAPHLLEATEGFADLEGICVTADRAAVYALSERDGSVWRFPLKANDVGAGERVGRLPRIGKRKNNGWEGIAHAPRGMFGDAEQIVACHQTGPRRIGWFDAHTLEEQRILSLPKAAKKELDDLNDLTLHPERGTILVLSGKAGAIAELRLAGEELELVALYPIPTAKRDVPEGITFDASGRLFIVTDGGGMLRELRIAAR